MTLKDIEESDFRFRYHFPLPDFYKVDNPTNPKHEISNELLEEFINLTRKDHVDGLSYAKLSDEFKKEWDIDWDNIIILKYAMNPEILKLPPSKDKAKLIDDEFQEIGILAYELADFLREHGFQATLINPLDDEVSLRAVAMQSKDAIILRSNMCLFKDGLNMGFFMIQTSIENLPFKKENDMLWVEKYCETCGKCIKKCPEKAYDENELILRKVCTAHREGCSECMLVCPFFKKGYYKLEEKFAKKLTEEV